MSQQFDVATSFDAAEINLSSGAEAVDAPPTQEAPSGAGRIPGLDEKNVDALMCVSTNLTQVCVNVAITTCVANALVNLKAPVPKPGALAQYAPAKGELLDALPRIRGLAPAQGLSRTLQKFTHKVRSAHQASLELSPRPLSPFRVPMPGVVQLANAWRSNCYLGLEAMQELEKICNQFGLEDWKCHAWEPLSTLLAEAAGGGYPGIEASGEVQWPSWAARRRCERIKVRTPAVLVRGSIEENVTLRDISGIGLAIEGIGAAISGEQVTVKLEGGETLQGTIRWVNNGKAGIELDR